MVEEGEEESGEEEMEGDVVEVEDEEEAFAILVGHRIITVPHALKSLGQRSVMFVANWAMFPSVVHTDTLTQINIINNPNINNRS